MAITELSNKEISARHISTNLANYEAARSGFFTLLVDFSKAPDGSSAVESVDLIKANQGAGASDVITSAKAQEILKLNVVSAPVPHFSVKVEEFKRGNDTIKFAGTPTFESGSIKVDDFIGVNAKDTLMAWQALTYNVHTRKGGRMKDYKKTATLIEYTQDFEEVRSWTLYGCWVSKLSESEFDKSNDGMRQITADIQYDYAYLNSDEAENE
jgi:hypothetical protein